jgi:hypothetical protein
MPLLRKTEQSQSTSQDILKIELPILDQAADKLRHSRPFIANLNLDQASALITPTVRQLLNNPKSIVKVDGTPVTSLEFLEDKGTPQIHFFVQANITSPIPFGDTRIDLTLQSGENGIMVRSDLQVNKSQTGPAFVAINASVPQDLTPLILRTVNDQMSLRDAACDKIELGIGQSLLSIEATGGPKITPPTS